MSVVGAAILGAALGFSLVVPPGPMNALILARSASSWRAGAATGAGALTADGILGAIVFTLRSIADLSSFIRVVYVLGSGVMVLLAYLLLRPRPHDAAAVLPSRTAYSQGLGLGLSNPYQIVWWLTAGVGFAYVGGSSLLVGLFGAIGIWVVTFPWVVRSGTRRFPAAEKWIRWASGSAMIGFAAYFAYLAFLPSV